MGYVLKQAITAEQLQNQTTAQETQSALDDIKQSVKDERNARSSEDINLRHDISFLQETLTAEISGRADSENQIKADLLTETNQRTAADSELQTALTAETNNRISADDGLRDAFNTALNQEKAARSQEIQDVQTAISVAMGNAQRLQEIENENLRRQLEAEAASQGTTLAALNERLTTEEQTRESEDTKLSNAISAESTARQSAISNLQSTLNAKIEQEIQNRTDSDSTLQTNLNNLQSTLNTKIDKEISDRSNAVTNLQTSLTNSINTEIQNRTNADAALENSLKGYVDGQISNVSATLNDFTAPTATTAGNRGLVPSPAAGTDLKLLTNFGWRSAGDTAITIANVPVQATVLTFNGAAQSPTWLNFDDKKLSISGQTSGTNAGEYTVTFTPIDIYLWEDTKDQSPKSATWRIDPLKLAKPTAAVTTFTFNNAAQGISVSNFDNTYESQTGTVSATNAGSYSAVYKLRNTSNTKWSDNSTADVTISWTINPLKLAKPTAAVTEFDADGTTHTLNVQNYNETYMNQVGTISASESGDYSVSYSLKNTTNTIWADSTTAAIVIEWSVANHVLTYAQSTGFEQLGTLTWNGYSQYVQIKNFDENYHQISGQNYRSSVGTYIAYVSPKNHYTWYDGTNTPIAVEWSIQPVFMPIPYLVNDYFVYDGNQKTVVIENYDGHSVYSGATYATEPGEYTLTFSPRNSAYVWEGGSSENIVLTWQIAPRLIPKPTCANNRVTFGGFDENYNAISVSPQVANFDENYITASGNVSATFPNSQNGVTSYKITYTLKNTTQTLWADESTAPVVIEWYIDPITLTAAQSTFTASKTNLEFTATNLGPVDVYITDYIAAFNNVRIENYKAYFDGGTPQTRYCLDLTDHCNKYVGDYQLWVDFEDWGFLWSDGTDSKKTLNWKVIPRSLPKPTATNSTLHYTGESQSLVINNFDWAYMTFKDNITAQTVSATDVGNYSTVIQLRKVNNEYVAKWSDSSTGDITINWSISGDSVSVNPNNLQQSGTLTYTGSVQAVEISGYDSNSMYLSGTTSATAAGDYTVTVNLKAGYTWSDSSTTPKSISWSILPLSLDVPYAPQTDFAYDGTNKTLSIQNYNSTYMNQTGTISAKATGTYSVTYSLKDKTNSKWASGSTDDIVIEWSIGLTKVTAPTIKTSSFTYSGNAKTPTFNNLDTTYMTASGDTSAINAGNYSITVALKDKSMYVWADGSSTDKTFTWQIKRKALTATQSNLSQSGTLTYTGSAQTVTISNYSTTYHSLGGTYVSTNAGDFVAQVEPLPNYCWNDSTFAAKYVTWSINPIKLAKPTASVTEFTYDKNAHALTIQNYNETYMNQVGTISATAASSYSVVYSLKNTTNTVWADSSIGNVYIAWNISKTQLTKPSIATSTFTYNGSNKTISIQNFDGNYMTQSGVTQAKDAGNYSVVISLSDTDLVEWDDSSVADLTLNWTIERAKLSTTYSNPYQKSIPTFKNSSISIKSTSYINGYNSTYQNWSGDTSGTNAGNYTAYVEPTANYTWNDGSLSRKTVTWSIAQAQISPPTVSDSVTLTYNGSAQSPTLTGYDSTKMTLGSDTSKINAGDYVLTVAPANSNYIWDDLTSDAKYLNWNIGYYILTPTPALKNRTNIYYRNDAYSVYLTSATSSGQAPAVVNFDSDTMVASKDLTATNPGTYHVSIAPKNENHAFSANSRTVGGTWYIYQGSVGLPVLKNNGVLSYTGEEQSPFAGQSDIHFQTDSDGALINKSPKLISVSGTTSASAVGNYSTTFHLLNTQYGRFSLKDSEGNTYYSTEDQTLNWSIGLSPITAPTLDSTYFDYTGSNQTVTISGFDSATMTKSGTETAKNRGFYKVTIKLKDKTNTCWSTGGGEDIVLEWAIGKKRIAKPTISGDTEFTYSGSAKTLSVTGFDADTMTQTGYLSATDAGNYTVTFALKSTTDYVWEDNSTASISFSWTINKATIANVTFSQSGTLTYTGSAQTVTVKNFNASTMDTSSTTSATNAGTYIVKISPKANYTWSDSTTTAKSVSWTINKKSLTKPTASTLNFDYDGTEKSLTITGYDSTTMNQTGTAKATDAGNYTVNFALKSTTNYQWQDGTVAAVAINWSIGGNFLAIPTISPTSQVSQGLTKTHSVTVSGFDSSTMTQTGTVSTSTGKAATYTVTFALKDKTNNAWSDGTTANKSLTWTVTKKVLSAAESTFTQTKTITYDGNSHSVTEAGGNLKSAYIGEYYTLSNSTGTNAGSYSTSITPTTAACWSDSSTSAKTFNWAISGAPTTLTLSATDTTITLTAANTNTWQGNSAFTKTITFTTNSDGDITVTTANSYVAGVVAEGFSGNSYTFAASKGEFRIYPYGNGETTITVNQATGSGHAAISKTITVKVVTARVFFSAAQISTLAKNGTLTNYMKVGDCVALGILTGTVGTKTLSGDYFVARLIGYDHNAGIEGTNRAHFAVFFGTYANANSILFDDDYGKNTNSGASSSSFVFYPTYSQSNTGQYYGISSLRTRCTEFLNILPTAWQNVITTCKKYFSTTSGVMSSVSDKVWIPSAFELTGSGAGYAVPDEIEQYEYFANGNSRAFNSKFYWTRDLVSSSGYKNAYINASGGISNTQNYHTSYGFLPCFTVS